MSGSGSPRRAARGLGKFEGFGSTSVERPVADEPAPAGPDVRAGSGRNEGEGQGAREARTERPAPAAPAPVPRPEIVRPPAASSSASSVSSAREAVATRSGRRQRGRRKRLEERFDCETIRTTIELPLAVDDALAQIVFEQRRGGVSKNDLLLEAVECVLKRYGAGSIKMLIEKDRAG